MQVQEYLFSFPVILGQYIFSIIFPTRIVIHENILLKTVAQCTNESGKYYFTLSFKPFQMFRANNTTFSLDKDINKCESFKYHNHTEIIIVISLNFHIFNICMEMSYRL